MKTTAEVRSFAAALRRAAAARRRRAALEAGARWCGLCPPGLALLLLLALFVPPVRAGSAILAGVAVAWIVATLVGLVVWPLVRAARGGDYALWLEQRAGLPRNELINALELERAAADWRDDAVSAALVERARRQGLETLERLPLARLHAGRPLLPPLSRAAAAALVPLALALVAPVRLGDALQLFVCAGSASVVPVVDLRVAPGDLTVERGTDVTIEASVAGRRRPRAAQIEMRATPEGAWTRAEMTGEQQAAGDRHLFLAAALKGDLEYRVRAGWVESPTYRIRVLEPLQALGYRKLYEPPAYTRMPPQRQVSATAEIAALTGTRVTLEVRPRRSGVAGRLLFEQPPYELALAPSGSDALAAAWVLDRDDRLRVELRDDAQGEHWISEGFAVDAVPDLDPSVRLLSPAPAITLPPDMHVVLAIDCVDDFGLTELALIYGRSEDDPTRATLATWEDRKEARLTYTWDLTDLAILPGQDLHYYLQVLDNDPVHGPKAGETELFTIRFPTMAEMYASAEEERTEEAGSLEDALQTQEALSEDLKEIAREMLREEKLSWERQQEVEALLDRQEALAEKVGQIQQSIEASRERMEMQNLFSMELIDKVREIQSLVSEIQNETFQNQMQQMRQALERMDRSALQKAMEQMKISQEEITQSLDRTLNLLRQLMAEEKLDQLLQQMEELATRQEMINEQLALHEAQRADEPPAAGGEPPEKEPEREGESPGEQASPPDEQAGESDRPLTDEEAADLAAQQEQVRAALEELRERIEALRKENEETLKEFAAALAEQMKAEEGKQADDQMRQAQEAMEQQNRTAALKFGRKAQQSLSEMSMKMSSLKQEIDIEKQMRLARSLYNIANRLVGASVDQEALVAEADRIGPRDLAVHQQELRDEVRAVGDSLESVARETPVLTRSHLRAVAKAIEEIEQARDQLEAGRRHTALTMAGESSRSLNAAVKGLLEAANQAQSNCASSCSSPFNKMQSLTGQQCELNQQTRQAMGAGQVPRPTMGQGEAMLRLAARQEMIRKGLDEVRQEMKGSGQSMNELGQAVEEMEELVEQLRTRQADPRLIERQEKILSRLLTAQRSIRKREESEERISRTGVDPAVRIGPGPLDLGESRREALERAMLRGAQDPVPAEYRGLVERYLRSLLRTTP